MSDPNEKLLDVMELMSLSADDPRRQELAERMRLGHGMTAMERTEWKRELALTDQLREALPQVEEPEGLEARLLKIAERQTANVRGIWLGHLARMRADWRHVAAVLTVTMGLIAGYVLWPGQSQAPQVVALDPYLGQRIALWAVTDHMKAVPLDIASDDANVVHKALASRGLDFPVVMLKPSQGVTLSGGGTCEFGSAKAAYTRWEGNGLTYTLYEFNGRDAGVPSNFIPPPVDPKDLWHDDFHYRVFVWPGQQENCSWALVMEKENAPNVFARYAYGADGRMAPASNY